MAGKCVECPGGLSGRNLVDFAVPVRARDVVLVEDGTPRLEVEDRVASELLVGNPLGNERLES